MKKEFRKAISSLEEKEDRVFAREYISFIEELGFSTSGLSKVTHIENWTRLISPRRARAVVVIKESLQGDFSRRGGITPQVLQELQRRWKGPPSPYREALHRVHSEIGNYVLAKKIVSEENLPSRIFGRVKDIRGIITKINKYALDTVTTIDELERLVRDIVGVRVILDSGDQVEVLQKWILDSRFWRAEAIMNLKQEEGYRGCHILLRVDTTHFHDVACEVQLRTVLQESWAAWTHPLYDKYGNEPSKIPKATRNRMLLLSELLNRADELVQSLKEEKTSESVEIAGADYFPTHDSYVVMVTDRQGKVVDTRVFRRTRYVAEENFWGAITRQITQFERKYSEFDYVIHQGSAQDVASFLTAYPELTTEIAYR